MQILKIQRDDHRTKEKIPVSQSLLISKSVHLVFLKEPSAFIEILEYLSSEPISLRYYM